MRFISLGYYCGPAASMEVHGLRTTSGPFDWYVSDYQGVIKTIEERFEHFLEFDNLVHYDERKHYFYDVKYGFLFNHEIGIGDKEDLRYQTIKEKYNKRIYRFLDMLKTPCCLIRAVKDENEIEYINNHYLSIEQMFKAYNAENIVVYLVPQNILTIETKFPFYKVNQCILHPDESPHLFEQNKDLLPFFFSNIEAEERIKNLAFFYRKQLSVTEGRYMVAMQLLNGLVDSVDFCQKIRKKVLIYGCGAIGKALYREISKKVTVLAFIDEFSWEEKYDSVDILKLEDYESLHPMLMGVDIIVTPFVAYEEIKQRIQSIYKNEDVRIFSVKELV